MSLRRFFPTNRSADSEVARTRTLENDSSLRLPTAYTQAPNITRAPTYASNITRAPTYTSSLSVTTASTLTDGADSLNDKMSAWNQSGTVLDPSLTNTLGVAQVVATPTRSTRYSKRSSAVENSNSPLTSHLCKFC